MARASPHSRGFGSKEARRQTSENPAFCAVLRGENGPAGKTRLFFRQIPCLHLPLCECHGFFASQDGLEFPESHSRRCIGSDRNRGRCQSPNGEEQGCISACRQLWPMRLVSPRKPDLGSHKRLQENHRFSLWRLAHLADLQLLNRTQFHSAESHRLTPPGREIALGVKAIPRFGSGVQTLGMGFDRAIGFAIWHGYRIGQADVDSSPSLSEVNKRHDQISDPFSS